MRRWVPILVLAAAFAQSALCHAHDAAPAPTAASAPAHHDDTAACHLFCADAYAPVFEFAPVITARSPSPLAPRWAIVTSRRPASLPRDPVFEPPRA